MRNIQLLLGKEWLDLRQQRGLLLSVLVLPLLLTIIPTAVLFGIRFAPGQANVDDFTQELVKLNPALRGMGPVELAQALPGQAFSTMYLLIPLMLPSIIAAYSIVGEKSNRTLEPLLATPIKTWELMAGKILAALVPTMLLTWLFGAIFITAARVAAVSPRVFSAIVSPGWLAVFILCTPLLALIAIAAMVAISARVNDPRTAQQYSAWLVVPFLAVFFGQLSGLVTLSPLVALLAALVLAIIAALAVWGATRLFQREAILTRWA